jgi:hypothetical protein
MHGKPKKGHSVNKSSMRRLPPWASREHRRGVPRERGARCGRWRTDQTRVRPGGSWLRAAASKVAAAAGGSRTVPLRSSLANSARALA